MTYVYVGIRETWCETTLKLSVQLMKYFGATCDSYGQHVVAYFPPLNYFLQILNPDTRSFSSEYL
jgi:hypothetical protein